MDVSASGPKKAIHVKWAGKTIALGTFPPEEAEEKCARAKALTRAWRSTMRPKPTRQWVMDELERLNVRVVSGRSTSTRKGDEGDEEGAGGPPEMQMKAGRKTSLGWAAEADFDTMMQRRSSSIGFSMMGDAEMKLRSSSMGLGHRMGMDDVVMPPHRPLVGGASAAAYEAARADHYSGLAARRGSDVAARHVSGFETPGSAVVSSVANQHYEMLKLHHMNLLNEIQETTLMMNLYQQQQLQKSRDGGDVDSGKAHPGSMVGSGAIPGGQDAYGSMYGGMPGRASGMSVMGALGPRGSLGMSAMASGPPMMDRQRELMAQVEERQAIDDRLQQIKNEIARRQAEADDLEAFVKKTGNSSSEKKGSKKPDKRKADEDDDDDDDDETEQSSKTKRKAKKTSKGDE